MGDHVQTVPGGTAAELRAAVLHLNRTTDQLVSKLTAQMNVFATAPPWRPQVGVFPSQIGPSHSYFPPVSHNPIHPGSYAVYASGTAQAVPDATSTTLGVPPPHTAYITHDLGSTAPPPGAGEPAATGFAGGMQPVRYIDANQPWRRDASGTPTHAAPAARRALPAYPDAVIPKHRAGQSWRDIIRQWEEDDTRTGRPALQKWPKEWYTGSMRTLNGVKYGQRREIAAEYNR